MLHSAITEVMKTNVHFDPSNVEHRRSVAIYLKTRSWKHTMERFLIEPPFTNIITMVTAKIAIYYAFTEFSELLAREEVNVHLTETGTTQKDVNFLLV